MFEMVMMPDISIGEVIQAAVTRLTSQQEEQKEELLVFIHERFGDMKALLDHEHQSLQATLQVEDSSHLQYVANGDEVSADAKDQCISNNAIHEDGPYLSYADQSLNLHSGHSDNGLGSAVQLQSTSKAEVPIASGQSGKSQSASVSHSRHTVPKAFRTKVSNRFAKAGSSVLGAEKVIMDIQTEIWRTIFGGSIATDTWYAHSVERLKVKESVWHRIASELKLDHILHTEAPNTFLARLVTSRFFTGFFDLIIFLNTLILAFEADQDVKEALGGEQHRGVDVIHAVHKSIQCFFYLEIVLRILGLRTWFFVAKNVWYWNVFDACLVLSSFFADVVSMSSLEFMRMLRMVRIIRMARLLRVLRVFRELREMFLAIVSCMASLVWAFVFLALTLLLFSIFFLQAIVGYLENLDKDHHEQGLVESFREWYKSLGSTMYTLLAAATGGVDWLEPGRPLAKLGWGYTGVYVFYVLFVTIGVMNILTGVFIGNASCIADRDISIHKENSKLDTFVHEMIHLFNEFELDTHGSISWQAFKTYISDHKVQAYLASHDLETTHGILLFDLLDRDHSGYIDVHEFVIGMVRLKGNAKALDARIIERDVSSNLNMLEREGREREKKIQASGKQELDYIMDVLEQGGIPTREKMKSSSTGEACNAEGRGRARANEPPFSL